MKGIRNMERMMHTLVEAADQLEGSPPTKEGEEKEKGGFPKCGESFSQSLYKFIVHTFVTQKLV